MQKQLEEIEQKLMAVYAELEKAIPGLHRLTFEIDKYDHLPNLKLHGFYHKDDDCVSYNDIDEIYNLWHRHHILFQKFNPI